MFGAALLTAQFVAARAARDAIYLAHLDATTLPQIVIATSVCSLGLIALSSVSFRRWSPAALVPFAFSLSAALFVVEWALLARSPAGVARLLYLHVSGLGPMLASAFWLIATETFDPHTAKKHFGRIGAAGTLGGVFGAVLAECVAAYLDAPAILIPLAVLNVACAVQMQQLALGAPADRLSAEASPELSAASAGSSLRVLAASPYLRNLGALVFLGTTGAAFLDYAFKVEAASALGRGDSLLRFFAAYYAGVSVLTFVVQVFASQWVLERLGLAAATAAPAVAAVAAGTAAVFVPGLPVLTVTRATESAARGSLFKAAYEILYTPVAPPERRAAKTVIDVGFDRLGDAAGGVLVRVAQSAAVAQPTVVVGMAIFCSALAWAAATRLRRGYVETLQSSLVNRAVELELSDVQDLTTRTVMFRSLGEPPRSAKQPTREPVLANIRDPELHKIADLRSHERARVVAVLQDKEQITAGLVPHIVMLLAWDDVAEDAVSALRAVAEERAGELTDLLLDRNQPFAVRRRLARVFSVCVSQRAADGLVAALDDVRFEVRFQCGRSLAAIVERNPRVRIDSARMLEAVEREVAVSRPVWESRQLLDKIDDTQSRSALDEAVNARANQSLAHVFALLSLAFPGEPLRLAFLGLQTNDIRLRGTALEYLEHILPAPLRQRLWPFLDAPQAPASAARPRSDVVAALLHSNPSIMMNLEELRRLSEAEKE